MGTTFADDTPGRGEVVPDATERPERFGPRRQKQHGDRRVCPGIGESDPHSVADAEVGGDRRTRACAQLTVSSVMLDTYFSLHRARPSDHAGSLLELIRPTGIRPTFVDKLRANGVQVSPDLFDPKGR